MELCSEEINTELTIVINRIMPLRDAREIVEKELITHVMNKVNSTYKADCVKLL